MKKHGAGERRNRFWSARPRRRSTRSSRSSTAIRLRSTTTSRPPSTSSCAAVCLGPSFVAAKRTVRSPSPPQCELKTHRRERTGGRPGAGRLAIRACTTDSCRARTVPTRMAQSTAGAAGPLPAALKRRGTETRPLRIYAFGVSRNRLEHAIEVLRVPATVVRDAREADIVLTLKNYFRQRAQPIRDAETRGIPVYVLRSNTGVQMEQLLSTLFPSKIDREVAAAPDWSRAGARKWTSGALFRRSASSGNLGSRGRNFVGNRRRATGAACPAGLPHSPGAAPTRGAICAGVP